MAGLQTIINNCNGLAIDRRKLVGIQYTRNEIPRTSSTPTRNPWRFTLDMPSSLRYNQARDLMEALDNLDRINPEVITFADNACLSWIFKYQGTMSQTMINNITVSDFTGDQLELTNLPVVPASRVLFEPNDLIQIGAINAYPYPFTSTTRVLRGTGSSVIVTTNRPNILTGNLVGQPIRVGNVCQFNMFCPNMPIYKLMPGGAVIQNGTVVNNALLEFSDSFNLYEYVGTA
jgi:hypothetical protein